MKKKDVTGTVMTALVGLGFSFAGEVILNLFSDKIAAKIKNRWMPVKQDDMLVSNLTVAEFKEIFKKE
jgi:ABC-type multidrug transport system ATPase subunit